MGSSRSDLMKMTSFRMQWFMFMLGLGVFSCEGTVEDWKLPTMYKMHDYEDCHKQKGLYCQCDFKIFSKDFNTSIWRALEDSRQDSLRLDRSSIGRLICIPQSENPETYALKIFQAELNSAETVGTLIGLTCEKQWTYPYYKLFICFFLITYTILTVISTRYYQKLTKNPNRVNAKLQNLFQAFSLVENTNKLFKDNLNEDFIRLKSIQGIRVLNTCLVIIYHSVISVFHMYVDDVDQLEKDFQHPFVFYSMFVGAFCVQTFFLISSFLLTNQIYELHKKHGHFSLYHCWILIVNRLFRFLPTLLTCLLLTTSGILDNAPHKIKLNIDSLTACSDWKFTLLQMNFLLPFSEICIPGYWYLSVDTLYYIATLLILYTVLNNNWNLYKIILILILVSITYFGTYLYVNEHQFMYQPYPNALKNILSDKSMTYVYIPAIASWPSSLMGLILGYVYFSYKAKIRQISLNPVIHVCWWLIVILLPIVTVNLATYEYKGIWSGVMGSLLKPLFAGSLGVGILGMAFGLGGILRRFLEVKSLFVLSNVTYCTYVMHFYVVFAKGVFMTELLHYEVDDLVSWIAFDIVMGFVAGTLFTILIENPGVTLQKMFIPQIKSERIKC